MEKKAISGPPKEKSHKGAPPPPNGIPPPKGNPPNSAVAAFRAKAALPPPSSPPPNLGSATQKWRQSKTEQDGDTEEEDKYTRHNSTPQVASSDHSKNYHKAESKYADDEDEKILTTSKSYPGTNLSCKMGNNSTEQMKSYPYVVDMGDEDGEESFALGVYRNEKPVIYQSNGMNLSLTSSIKSEKESHLNNFDFEKNRNKPVEGRAIPVTGSNFRSKESTEEELIVTQVKKIRVISKKKKTDSMVQDSDDEEEKKQDEEKEEEDVNTEKKKEKKTRQGMKKGDSIEIQDVEEEMLIQQKEDMKEQEEEEEEENDDDQVLIEIEYSSKSELKEEYPDKRVENFRKSEDKIKLLDTEDNVEKRIAQVDLLKKRLNQEAEMTEKERQDRLSHMDREEDVTVEANYLASESNEYTIHEKTSPTKAQQSSTSSINNNRKSNNPIHVIDPRKVPIGDAELKKYILSPLDGGHGHILRCFIERTSSGQHKFSPIYTLLLEINSSSGRPILYARKLPTKLSNSHYVISINKEDLYRKRNERSEYSLGKLRTHNQNLLEYTLYDDGDNPESIFEELVEKDKTVYKSLRQEYCYISYRKTINTSARNMEVAIPSIDVSDKNEMLWRPRCVEESIGHKCIDIIQLGKQNMRIQDGLICLHKRETKYDALSSCIVDFKSRATCISIKNFQLVHSSPTDLDSVAKYENKFKNYVFDDQGTASIPPDKVILQFGKVGKDCFNMDFQYPLSIYQAFAICLSRFDTKQRS